MRENKARLEAVATQNSSSQIEDGARTGGVLDSALGLRSDAVQQESFPLIRKLGDLSLSFWCGEWK